jgi:hypothetical protein
MLSIDDLFKGRHFDREIIVLCVRWYLGSNSALGISWNRVRRGADDVFIAGGPSEADHWLPGCSTF